MQLSSSRILLDWAITEAKCFTEIPCAKIIQPKLCYKSAIKLASTPSSINNLRRKMLEEKKQWIGGNFLFAMPEVQQIER